MNLEPGRFRAFVTRGFAGGSFGRLDVYLQHPNLGLYRPGVDDTFDRYERPADDGAYAAPSFRLDDEAARALLDALAAHFGGTSEVQTMRADLLHERKRVDKMIDHLIGEAP